MKSLVAVSASLALGFGCKAGVYTPKTDDPPAHCDSYTPPAEGLLLWLKADSISASDGDVISSWDDQSGNGLHFTQSDSTKAPVFKTNIINGLPALRFDGVNDVLEGISLGQIGQAANNGWQISLDVVLANYTTSGSTADDNVIANFVIGSTVSGYRLNFEGGTGKVSMLSRSNETDSANRVVTSLGVLGSLPITAGGFVIFKDRGIGMEMSSVTSNSIPLGTAANGGAWPIGFGSYHWTQSTATLKDSIGGDLGSATGFLSADIAEIIVYRNLTPYVRPCEDESKYLGSKYGF